MLSVYADTKQLTRHLNRVQRKQIPFAAMQALNDVAFDARSLVQKSLPRRLHKPTKGTVKSVQVEKAKKDNLTARVGFAGLGFGKTKWRESPAEIMRRHIKGGTRRPVGKAIAVPVKLKVNQYGNIPRGKVKKLLAKPEKYFSGEPHGRPGGIYERKKRTKNKPGKLTMLIAWEPMTKYKGGRFPLKRIVETSVKNKYKKRFDSALSKALRTAR